MENFWIAGKVVAIYLNPFPQNMEAFEKVVWDGLSREYPNSFKALELADGARPMLLATFWGDLSDDGLLRRVRKVTNEAYLRTR